MLPRANPVNCTVKNVTITSEKGDGLTLHGVKNAVVDNVTVTAYKCGFAVAVAEKVTFTNCTVNVCEAEGHWLYDIGCMYKAGSSSYPSVSHIVLGEGNDFGYGWIYGEHPDGDTVEGFDSSWTLKYKTDENGETLKTWDLRKN